MVIEGEVGRGDMADAVALLQGAAAGAQRGGRGEQVGLVEGPGPISLERGLEFAAGADAGVAKIGGDGHRKRLRRPVHPARP